ncbi:hypothetical protein CXQ85_004738 [Candidozyma haemuli]|uniref:Uncharacterized protein n=1 Tax=Candidozyma haemuli TaxID=45357 RepID=A0A2V1AWA6_9ASCO|nr:hypothetical protein CXQ85_004738 [[Candida] haemuloni]PVH22069.1 hypothetical protein CXQ85_004738 [[Candida] haemuloni]
MRFDQQVPTFICRPLSSPSDHSGPQPLQFRNGVPLKQFPPNHFPQKSANFSHNPSTLEMTTFSPVAFPGADDAPSSPKKKSFWRRLFSRRRSRKYDDATKPDDNHHEKASFTYKRHTPITTRSAHAADKHVVVLKDALGLNTRVDDETPKPYGTPEGTTYEAFQRMNGNLFPSLEPHSFVMKPIDSTTNALEFKQGNLSATFRLKSFRLQKSSDGSLSWRPSAEVPRESPSSRIELDKIAAAAFEERPVALPDLRSSETYASVGCSPVPKWAADIAELRKNIPDAENLTIFQALRFAQKAEKNPVLAELIKEVAYNEFINYDTENVKALKADGAFARSPRESFAGHFEELTAKYVSSSSPSSTGVPSFRPRAASVHTFVSPSYSDKAVDGQAQAKRSKRRRLSLALGRLSRRWSSRAKLFREHWREDRVHRDSAKETKRSIKVEKRNIALLDKEKQLLQLQSQVSKASHQKAQEEKDHQQAEYHRQLAAKQAAQRRKLELLENKAVAAEAGRKVAAALKRNKVLLDNEVNSQFEKVSPQTSSKTSSSKRSKKSTSTSMTTPTVSPSVSRPGNSSSKVSPKQGLAGKDPNGYLDDREMEENPWNIGGDVELRSVIAKERPLLGIKPKKTVVGSRVVSVASSVHSEESELKPFVPVPYRPTTDAYYHGFAIPRVDAPPPPRPTGAPFWERNEWVKNRMAMKGKMTRYIATPEEVLQVKAKLRSIPFAMDW